MEDTKLAKVLVVDDEPNIVELLTVSLKFQNFEVFSANSGHEALRVAREVNPDAYILDVMMPGMDVSKAFEIAPTKPPCSTACTRMSGTLTFLEKPIAKLRASEPNMPTSQIGEAAAGSSSTTNQVPTAVTSMSPMRMAVLTNTSSRLRRPVRPVSIDGAW